MNEVISSSKINILVPDLPESVKDATIISWHKNVGDEVKRDDVLVEIETDKVVLEIPSISDGILCQVLYREGDRVLSHQVIGMLKKDNKKTLKNDVIKKEKINELCLTTSEEKVINDTLYGNDFSPMIRRLIAKNIVNIDAISDIKKNDVLIKKNIIEKRLKDQNRVEEKVDINKKIIPNENNQDVKKRNEKRIPMTSIRKCIAERLLKVKNNTAMLTTFNEVNMKKIQNVRKKYSEIFEKNHGIKLGYTSFYVKAVSKALKYYPKINASIDKYDIIYRDYFDISIAVSTDKGLVTPVLRNVDCMNMGEIENKVKELALKARSGKITIAELVGGNFTITNGGVFGSLMSTPIINPPQSAILGVHAIKDRPVAIEGEVKILPMMYVALSYDHRLIDGRESVSFLSMIKNILEDPVRLLLDI